MHPNIDLHDPSKLEQNESAMLERIRQGNLLTWIYGNAKIQSNSEEFMKGVCAILNGMQHKGLISGFREAVTGGQKLPIVSRVLIPAPTNAMVA